MLSACSAHLILDLITVKYLAMNSYFEVPYFAVLSTFIPFVESKIDARMKQQENYRLCILT
jgi:hypothetical protein